MADPIRNPSSGRFANASPTGAAAASGPGLPAPGLNDQEDHAPLPLLDFSQSSSPCQSAVDLTAISTPPGLAGPVVVTPTTPMQDFGQVMGRTMNPVPRDPSV